VKQLTAYDDSKTRTAGEGRHARETARGALIDRLRSIQRTARVIARKSPGFADRFKMPNADRAADQAILAAGRIFTDAAESLQPQFQAHGMPDTFVADVRRLVEAFDASIRNREAGREQRAVAQKGVSAALAAGLAAVRTLDVIVANQLGGDADAMAAWEHDRKVGLPRRAKKGGAAPAAASTEPEPPAGNGETARAVDTPGVPSAIASPGGTPLPSPTIVPAGTVNTSSNPS
jgi:hypothetical protein